MAFVGRWGSPENTAENHLALFETKKNSEDKIRVDELKTVKRILVAWKVNPTIIKLIEDRIKNYKK
jgi:hypothetical protein